ncbi:hypothetical protein ACOMHN_033221 [Nucella lapillus]
MPHRNKHDMEQLDKSLNLLTQNGKKDCPIVLAGDFWINHTTHSTGKDNDIQQSLVDIMQSSTLTQVHHSPTRFMNILDLIFFSNPSLVKSSVSVPGISDHEMIVTGADTRPQRYFMYDFLDLALNGKMFSMWEVQLHHVSVGFTFYYNLVCCEWVSFNTIALLVEVNSFFLHQRKLLQMLGTPYDAALYRVTAFLNLSTFVVFRGISILFVLWGMWALYHLAELYFYICLCWSMFFMVVMNPILFMRLLRSDYLRDGSRGKQQKEEKEKMRHEKIGVNRVINGNNNNCLVGFTFYYNLVCCEWVSFNTIALLVEVNSFFLHQRKLLQMLGTPYDAALYRVTAFLNLSTFVVFRGISILFVLWGMWALYHLAELYFYICLCWSMFFMVVMNPILFMRLLRSDYLRDGSRGKQQKEEKEKMRHEKIGVNRVINGNNNNCLVGFTFYYNLVCCEWVSFNTIALLVEVNSFFLHQRKLLQMLGTPYDAALYRVTAFLNLSTFVVFRGISILFVLWGMWALYHLAELYFYICLCWSMFFMVVMNPILFMRLLRSDYLRDGSRGKQQKEEKEKMRHEKIGVNRVINGNNNNCLVGFTFYYNLVCCEWVSFNTIALLVEVNSFFLHQRKLLQMLGTPYDAALYRVTAFLNLSTFVVFRGISILFVLWGMWALYHLAELYFYICLCWSMFFMVVMNPILFMRLLRSDYLRDGSRGKQQKEEKEKMRHEKIGVNRVINGNNNNCLVGRVQDHWKQS